MPSVVAADTYLISKPTLKPVLISAGLFFLIARKQPRSSHCCTTGAHDRIIHLIRGLWAQRQVRDRETLDYWGTAGTAMGNLTSSMNSLLCYFREGGKGRRRKWPVLNFLFTPSDYLTQRETALLTFLCKPDYLFSVLNSLLELWLSWHEPICERNGVNKQIYCWENSPF